MSIRTRLIAGFMALCAVLVGTVVLTNQSVSTVEHRMKRITNGQVPTASATADLETALYAAALASRSWIVVGDPIFKQERQAAWREIEELRDTLDTLSSGWNDSDIVAMWSRFKSRLGELRVIQDELEELAHSGAELPATKMLVEKIVPLTHELFEHSSALIDIEKGLSSQPERKELLGLIADIRGTMEAGMGDLHLYVFTGDSKYLEYYRAMAHLHTERLALLRTRQTLLTGEQRAHSEKYDETYRALRTEIDEMIRIRGSEQWNLIRYRMLNHSSPIIRYLMGILSGAQREDGGRSGGLVDLQHEKLASDASATSAELKALQQAIIFLFGFGLLASLLLVRLMTRSIVRPIAGLVTAIEHLTQGDTTVKVPGTERKDELGHIARAVESLNLRLQDVATLCRAISLGNYNRQLEVRSSTDLTAVAVNQMVEDFRQIVMQARLIARGDYSTGVTPKSEHDALGIALSDMTCALREMSERNHRDSWLRNGQRTLAEVMQGKQTLEELCRNVVGTLAKYLDVSVGALYILERDTLRLTSSYAFTKRKHLKTEIPVGEGLVGQVALERQRILLTEIPDDYIYVSSGLGESRPKHIAVHPLLMGSELKGVIELGSLGELSALQIELLEMVSENIAIAVNTAENLQKMQRLLEQSRRQAEELQAQSEELQATNEELAEKTERLARSQTELKAQSEELQAINEELEEKTRYLELKKSEVEGKNRELDLARKELEQRARELEQSSKYKSQFLANMSHELRTPLNSILILAKVLADNSEGNLSEDQVNAASVIHSGGKDLLHLINDILDLSKVEAGMLTVIHEPVDLGSLCVNLRQQFEPVATEKSLAFVIEQDTGLPKTIRADRLRLEQILKNLLSNAFKFTEKGSVRLRIYTPSGSLSLRTSSLQAERAIGFSVTDTGPGIAEEKQQDIFEAFQQGDGSTSRKYGGTGLGLTISRELARLLGGEIHVQSQMGAGSTFTLYLPLDGSRPPETGSSPEGASHLQALSPAPAPGLVPVDDQRPATAQLVEPAHRNAAPSGERENMTRGDRSLLVIEDDVAFAQILLDMAHRKGYKCILATDGPSGLRLALESRPSAIILDLALPGLDGLTVLEQLKFHLHTRHIPVHIISARSESATALQMGAVGYLTKPVTVEDISQIFAKVERYLEKRVKSVLLVEDDRVGRDAIVKLIGNDTVEITAVSTGKAALDTLRAEEFDCMILDLQLPDTSGFALLRTLKADATVLLPPVIIYTGRDLTREEHKELTEYASSIVIKGANSPERLIDEASLFLHSIETSLPPEQQHVIRSLHDPGQVLRGRKILLVDDNVRNSFALSGALRKHGLEVVLADNGQLAIEMLHREPNIDLVVMDIMMPIMDGYEAIAKMRQDARWATMPVIALTAKAMPEDRVKCLEAGANDFLTKPVDLEQLLALMRVWLFKV